MMKKLACIMALLSLAVPEMSAQPEIQSQWNGARVAFLGDSITDPNQIGIWNNTYWNLMRDILGIEPYVYGISGHRMDHLIGQGERLEAEHGQEVDAIMDLVTYGVRMETPNLIERGARMLTIGDLSRLPQASRESLEYCKKATAHCDKVTLVLALNYSSRWELTEMAKELARKAAMGEIDPEEIDAETISSHLTTADFPDPDLLIRTGGEQRISNYLLWQISYSELYFCDTFWPDFGADDLYKAIVEFQNRERRFGKTSAQVQEETK